MINKKSQSGMEFLMTYGWAILAAVIAIGIFVYFWSYPPIYEQENNITDEPNFTGEDFITSANVSASNFIYSFPKSLITISNSNGSSRDFLPPYLVKLSSEDCILIVCEDDYICYKCEEEK